jgi:hypothetical protein
VTKLPAYNGVFIRASLYALELVQSSTAGP